MENNEILNKLSKYLFIFDTQPRKLVLNYFSLQKFNYFMAVFGIIGAIATIIYGILYGNFGQFLWFSLVDIASLISCIYVFLGLYQMNATYTYYGYIISAYKMVVYFTFHFINIILLFNGVHLSFTTLDGKQKTLMNSCIEYLSMIVLTFYFLLMNYSLAFYAAKGEWRLIEGNVDEFDKETANLKKDDMITDKTAGLN